MNRDEQERRAIAEEHLDAPQLQPPHVTDLVDPFDDLTLAEGAEVRALRRSGARPM
jgi:hypothetical protein